MGMGMLKYFYGLLSSKSEPNVLYKEGRQNKMCNQTIQSHDETPKRQWQYNIKYTIKLLHLFGHVHLFLI